MLSLASPGHWAWRNGVVGYWEGVGGGRGVAIIAARRLMNMIRLLLCYMWKRSWITLIVNEHNFASSYFCCLLICSLNVSKRRMQWKINMEFKNQKKKSVIYVFDQGPFPPSNPLREAIKSSCLADFYIFSLINDPSRFINWAKLFLTGEMISFLNLSLTDSLNPVFSWLATSNGKAQLASFFRMLPMSLGSKIFCFSKKKRLFSFVRSPS